MLQRFSVPEPLSNGQYDGIKWSTIERLLQPLEKDWPDIVIEAKMGIAKNPDPYRVGEILVRGFRQLIESLKEGHVFAAAEAKEKQIRAEIASVCKENDQLTEQIARVKQENNEQQIYILSQKRVIADLHHQIQNLSAEAKEA
jgi:predicted RNase H-like nuclease (RuvC/YqgF family)